MIYIENDTQYKRVLEYTVNFKKKQTELETDDTFIYPSISLPDAIRYKVLFEEFLFHPLILKTRKFYDIPVTLEHKKDIIEAITSVIEYELLSDSKDTHLSAPILKKIIASHKRLTKSRAKNDSKPE